MKSGQQQRDENDRRGLGWLAQFRWLRSLELGRLMWPNDATGRIRADRVIRGWIARDLVITRTLPDDGGKAFVLSAKGAGLVGARSGKDWGEQYPRQKGVQKEWRAPATWQHELIAAGALACLFEQGFHIMSEHALKQLPEVAGLSKIPDGLAWKDGYKAIWLEVENSVKSGKRLAELADWMSHISSSSVPAIAGQPVGIAMVVYHPDAVDGRGYHLDHRTRLTAKIQQRATSNVAVIWASCHMIGRGIRALTFEQETIEASKAARVLAVLNAREWQEDKDGSLWSTYDGGYIARVWKDENFGPDCWAYQLEKPGQDFAAELVDNISDAKRGAANAIAELIAKPAT